MRHKLITLWLIIFVAGALAPLIQASVPQNMNVSGRLADSVGNALGPLVFTFSFTIFDKEGGPGDPGVDIWPGSPGGGVSSESHTITTDANGVWIAILGEFIGLTPDVFSDSSRWLEITIDDGTNPPETLNRIKLSMSPYAGRSASSKVADNGIPVGTVIDWWAPGVDYVVPDGFQICDGSIVVDPLSPLVGDTLPDLRDMFVRGANVSGGSVYTGGSDSHSHNMTVDSTFHNHAANPTLVATTPSDQAHNHSHDHFIISKTTTADSHDHFHDHPSRQTTASGDHDDQLFTAVGANHKHVQDHIHHVDLFGITSNTDTHVHGFQFDLASINSSTSLGPHQHTVDLPEFFVTPSAHNHAGTSGSGDNVPAFVALLKIMRIR